ncbi:CocE/NonD family hydrolase [Thermodesulfobacteriota bacterium]
MILPKESFKLEVNVPAKMRDGTILYADIWRPDTEDKYPAILTRLPYDKNLLFTWRPRGYTEPLKYLHAGYVIVIQDCRGRGVSEGEFYPFISDPEDGYDTVEWIAAQPWCDGNVGMYGHSALGGTQWAAAVTQPPHLKTICPGQCSGIARRGQMMRDCGVFRWNNLVSWYLGFCAESLSRTKLPPEELKLLGKRISQMVSNFEEQCRVLPLKKLDVKELDDIVPFYSDWLTHIEDDEYWSQFWNADNVYEKIVIPAFHHCGWNDDNVSGILASYQGMKERGGSEPAQKNQKLIVGPWVHGAALLNTVGDLNYGAASTGRAIDLTGMHIRWFDYWLKGIDNGIIDEPPVKIFVMGDNIWRDEYEWPLARTKYTPYYFHSKGGANSRSGDGILNSDSPADESTDNYLYDPHNPVPARGGINNPALNIIEVEDQEEVEKRTDVLVYTSAPLQFDLEVTGPIEIKLWASSSAVDTDFTGNLVDVWPNGKAYNLSEGIVRARYRQSLSEPNFIEPGKIYEYSIKMKPASNVFKTGHRIRVQISSSNFPKYDRNQNTGHAVGQDDEVKVAEQTIYHNKQYPSHIVLPVIPR